MKQKIILANLLLAACSQAATSTLINSVPWLSMGAPNGRKIATAGPRLYSAAAADDGSSALVINSTIDGVNWSTQNIPNLASVPLHFALASDDVTLAVLYQDGPSQLKLQWCVASNSTGNCSWNGPVNVGTGTTPSLALVKGVAYAAWIDGNAIRMSTFALNTWNPPAPVTIHPGSSIERNRLPSVTGWWNTAAGKPIVDIYWHYSAASAAPWPLSLWIVRRHSLDTAGNWTSSSRKVALTPITQHVTAYSVASSVNSWTGAVTVAVSTDDWSGGPKTFLFNDTSETVIAQAAWVTLDSSPGCNAAGVRVAVAPSGPGTSFHRVYNRSTLAPVGNAVTLPAGTFMPVASTWSRYASTISGVLATGYTDYVDSIHGVPSLGLLNLVADSRRVNGLQWTQPCFSF